MVDYIQRVSITMAPLTLVNGKPPTNWSYTQSRSDWGTLQLVIGGVDLTAPRGEPFIPISDGHTEPFGDENAVFAFPGISEYEDPIPWGLTPLADVLLRRIAPGGAATTLYEGNLASLEPDAGQGLVVHCMGVLYRLDLHIKPRALNLGENDLGNIIADTFNTERYHYGLNVGSMPYVTTGITGVKSQDFKRFLTGTIQDYLAEMTTDSGGQWTVAVQRPRTPNLVLKDTTTVHATVSYGAPGVSVQLSKDFTTATTGVYGTGSNGHCEWIGAMFPNLVQTATPTFPLGSGSTFTAGSGTTGFAPFAAYLRRGHYGTIVSDDTYDAADFDNVEQFQDRAGITVDGIVGRQTWEAAFQPGAEQGSPSGAWVHTIYELHQTQRRIYNAQGADVGANPNYDPTVPSVQEYIPFGDNVDKNLARKSAKQVVNRSYPAGRTGTITLTTDPIEMSRWDLYAGQNILVQNYQGGSVLLHISRRDRNWDQQQVVLTVDERARDLMTLAAIHQREKNVADLAHRQVFRQRSKQYNDYGQWACEDGAGEIPIMSQQGGFWNVQRVASGPRGTVARVSLNIGADLSPLASATPHGEHLLNLALNHKVASIGNPARAAMAIFAQSVVANDIANLPGLSTPLTFDANGLNPWDVNADALRNLGMIYAAGGPGQALGFYPNNDPGDGTDTNLTGMYEDGGSFDFGPTGYYWLWVAIWTPVDTFVGGRLYPGPPN